MLLATLPRVERLTLAVVTAVPEWHPDHRGFEPYPVHAWVIRHPQGAVLVDTGIGTGNEVIDEWYRPRVASLVGTLGSVGLEPTDVIAIVLSHLHFDHCGQQADLPAPVYVQAIEHESARAPHYTVAEWADIPPSRLRRVEGDEEILDGVSLLATPGHTPGHQSVVVAGGGRAIVLAAQCASRSDQVRTGRLDPADAHDDSWQGAARRSLERILSLAPADVHLSHDPDVVSLPVTGRGRHVSGGTA